MVYNDYKIRQVELMKWVLAQGGEWRESKKGVLHGIIDYAGQKASVCYFHKTKIIRMFFPYPGAVQSKLDFGDVKELESFIKNRSR